MQRAALLSVLLCSSAVLLALPAFAGDRATGPAARARPIPRPARGVPRAEERKGKWGLSVRAFFLRQLESDLPGGGRWSASRFLSEARVSYRIQPKIPLTIAFGYRYDSYDFSGVPVGDLWSSVHSPSAALPIFVPLNERWSVLAVGTVRSSFEDGAGFSDGLTGGAWMGALYKVNERLTIGPGIGVTSSLDESATIFPVPLVRWAIRPDLMLETGTGIGASLGPGLFLKYEPNACWRTTIGARFDRVRFRLDDQGLAPGGVGEESAFNLVGGVTYRYRKRIEVSLTGGVGFGGTVKVEDAAGNTVYEQDPDPRFFLGSGLGFEL